MNAPSPASVAEAVRIQEQLKERLDLASGLAVAPTTIAGVDVSYVDGEQRVAGAAVVIDVSTLETVESATVLGEVTFPYVPGLLAFREVPILLATLGELTHPPDVVVCDGYGIAHPRRFGLACHLGVLTGRPTFGVAKTPFTATFAEPGPHRGEWSPLLDDGEVLGRVVRTQNRVKPVFVSVGHRISLDEATALTLAVSRYRLPETTRRADSLSRAALRAPVADTA